MNKSIFRVGQSCTISFAGLLLSISQTALAGPPLTIDDPGVLDPGQWEIITAVTYADTTEGSATQLPILDVSYGVTENVQVSAAYPYVFVDPKDDSSDNDFGNLQVGAKWRFFNGENLQLAVAPLYAFGISVNAAKRGVGDDEDALFVPLEIEYTLGNWRFNGEFGYASIKNEPDGWGYGAAVAHPLGTRTEIMFELYGGADDDFDNDNLNYHVGFDFAWSEDLHILVSAGSGLTEPAREAELDFDFFRGLQYFR